MSSFIIDLILGLCIAYMLIYIADEEERKGKKMNVYEDVGYRAYKAYEKLCEKVEHATKSVERWEKLKVKNPSRYILKEHLSALNNLRMLNYAKEQLEWILNKKG